MFKHPIRYFVAHFLFRAGFLFKGLYFSSLIHLSWGIPFSYLTHVLMGILYNYAVNGAFVFKLLILLIVFLTVVVPFIFRLIGAMTEPERLKAWEGKRVRKKLESQFGEFKPDPRMQKIGHRLGVAGGVHGNFYKVPG